MGRLKKEFKNRMIGDLIDFSIPENDPRPEHHIQTDFLFTAKKPGKRVVRYTKKHEEKGLIPQGKDVGDIKGTYYERRRNRSDKKPQKYWYTGSEKKGTRQKHENDPREVGL